MAGESLFRIKLSALQIKSVKQKYPCAFGKFSPIFKTKWTPKVGINYSKMVTAKVLNFSYIQNWVIPSHIYVY